MLPVIARLCRPGLTLQTSRAFAVVGHVVGHALSALICELHQSEIVCCLQAGDALPLATRNAPDPAQQDTQAHARPSELPSDAQDAMHQAVPAFEGSSAAAGASTDFAASPQAADEAQQPQRRRPRLTVTAPMPRFIAPTTKMFKQQMNLDRALDLVKVSLLGALDACGCTSSTARAMVSACTLSEAP